MNFGVDMNTVMNWSQKLSLIYRYSPESLLQSGGVNRIDEIIDEIFSIQFDFQIERAKRKRIAPRQIHIGEGFGACRKKFGT
jgi:hypothetical protein